MFQALCVNVGSVFQALTSVLTLVLCSRPNTVLRLRFNHFATECSWDHLYVYDGDSIYAPLLAAFRYCGGLPRRHCGGGGGVCVCVCNARLSVPAV